mgnify:CR=1 FL=1
MSNLLLWVGALAAAQTPSDPWRTVRTEHFRIHYPLAAATWSEGAAARLEEWHARVVAEVGWQSDRKIDVLVVDPPARADRRGGFRRCRTRTARRSRGAGPRG